MILSCLEPDKARLRSAHVRLSYVRRDQKHRGEITLFQKCRLRKNENTRNNTSLEKLGNVIAREIFREPNG